MFKLLKHEDEIRRLLFENSGDNCSTSTHAGSPPLANTIHVRVLRDHVIVGFKNDVKRDILYSILKNKILKK